MTTEVEVELNRASKWKCLFPCIEDQSDRRRGADTHICLRMEPCNSGFRFDPDKVKDHQETMQKCREQGFSEILTPIANPVQLFIFMPFEFACQQHELSMVHLLSTTSNTNTKVVVQVGWIN